MKDKKNQQTILAFEQPIAELEQKLDELKQYALTNQVDISGGIERLSLQIESLKKETYAKLTRWQKVEVARHPDRPRALGYIRGICDEFIELHGDRRFGDDKALVGGLGKFKGKTVMFIGQQKGKGTKDNLYRNFGMANPEGYRKALRLMKLAEKFEVPVVTLIDTPGAFPGLEAEERGQGEAIARNLREMFQLKVPIVAIVIGEGASGGALGIGIGDRVLMMEYTWYSVISPESCSQILWRSWNFKEQAAEALKLAAEDMQQFGIVDGIIEEPEGGAHSQPQTAIANVQQAIEKTLEELQGITTEKLLTARIDRFASIGEFEEVVS